MARKLDKTKPGTKDSIFTHLFSIPQYQLQLYRTLHPEDKHVKTSDIELITRRCVVAQHEHNDLGLLVKDRLMILVEAQSSWTPNIVIRLMSYAIQSMMDYFQSREVFLYGNSKVVCPKPELYVIFIGERKDMPETLSFRDLFFAGDKTCDLDATAHIIYYKDGNADIINQYIMFCHVFNAQIKLYGYSGKALTETLRICRDKNILSKYILQREAEIMDIMTALFDQDYITRMYGIECKREEKRNIARSLKAAGMNDDFIEKHTGLSKDEIRKLNVRKDND